MTTLKTLLAAAFAGLALLVVVTLQMARGADGAPALEGQVVSSGEYTITGPHAHDNLAVFLIHGPDAMKGKSYLTLQEAMAQKLVIVHETGNVNELAIENVSRDREVYVQSGDIVKGGRQDRTIAQDFICAPGSGKVPIDAFCVEHGRWSGRGRESSAAFATSENAIAGKSLKLAAKQQKDQGAVWRHVTVNQQKLSANAGESVADARSASSYELTLENKKVQETTDAYVKDLQKIIEGQGDVIGYAFAINGKVNSAEVYGSHDLFLKLWPKLLRSSAVEAFAEVQKDKKVETATASAVKAAIEDAAKGKSEQEDITPRVTLITRETKDNVVYETRDRKAADGWLHRSYLTKDEPSIPGDRPANQHRAPGNRYQNSENNAPAQQQGQQQQEVNPQPSTRQPPQQR